LEKSVKWSREIAMSVPSVPEWWWRIIHVESSKGLWSQSGLTQNLTISNFFANFFSFRCMKKLSFKSKNNMRNPAGAYKGWDQKIINFSPLKPIQIFRPHRSHGLYRKGLFLSACSYPDIFYFKRITIKVSFLLSTKLGLFGSATENVFYC
jgi:hypothetical protein